MPMINEVLIALAQAKQASDDTSFMSSHRNVIIISSIVNAICNYEVGNTFGDSELWYPELSFMDIPCIAAGGNIEHVVNDLFFIPSTCRIYEYNTGTMSIIAQQNPMS